MKLRFGTFNLFQFAAPPYSWYTKKEKFTKEEWEEKLLWIKNQILKMDCDIIGFQEVFTHKELKELLFELGFKYFEIVDFAKLRDKDSLTFVTTTVAIASKYPITKLENVEVNGKSIIKHHFKGHFKFQRVPIKATIKLPNEKEILVYISHLKSNRLNEFEYHFTKNDTLTHKKELVEKALQAEYSESLKQRLCEASSLFFDIKKSIDTPTIFMCDLNDREFSLAIDALTNKAYHNNRLKKDEFILYDAHNLYDKPIYNPHPEAKEPVRTATSYYLGVGNVLDYIFVSKEFNKSYKNSIAKITSYEVLDEHLKANHDGSLLQSDHAQVVCEVEFK